MTQEVREAYSRRLAGMLSITAKIINDTGLLIRAPVQAQMYKIGGGDQYPMTQVKVYKINNNEEEIEVPYIPGSSLKGRIRGLLELSSNVKLYSSDQKIWQHVRNINIMDAKDFLDDISKRCVIDELFGWAAVNKRQLMEKFGAKEASEIYSKLAPTRLLVSDFFPTEEYVQKLYNTTGSIPSISDFLEDKSENRIDRITSAADPRTVVRVRPGVEFQGSLKLLLFDNDKDVIETYLKTLVTGLKLVENTYLGGSGSRGYGRVRFKDIEVNILKVKVEKVNGVETVMLESVPISKVKSKYSSLDEFEKSLKELADVIRNSLYQH